MGHRSFFVYGRFKRYLRVGEDNRVRINKAAVREAGKYDGKWVLIINDDTISVQDAAAGYKGLFVIERCFRTLKATRIEIEPTYHWMPPSIEAHVKLCVFTLLIESVAKLKWGQPWSRIRQVLATLQVSEFHTPKFQFFQRNETRPSADKNS